MAATRQQISQLINQWAQQNGFLDVLSTNPEAFQGTAFVSEQLFKILNSTIPQEQKDALVVQTFGQATTFLQPFADAAQGQDIGQALTGQQPTAQPPPTFQETTASEQLRQQQEAEATAAQQQQQQQQTRAEEVAITQKPAAETRGTDPTEEELLTTGDDLLVGETETMEAETGADRGQREDRGDQTTDGQDTTEAAGRDELSPEAQAQIAEDQKAALQRELSQFQQLPHMDQIIDWANQAGFSALLFTNRDARNAAVQLSEGVDVILNNPNTGSQRKTDQVNELLQSTGSFFNQTFPNQIGTLDANGNFKQQQPQEIGVLGAIGIAVGSAIVSAWSANRAADATGEASKDAIAANQAAFEQYRQDTQITRATGQNALLNLSAHLGRNQLPPRLFDTETLPTVNPFQPQFAQAQQIDPQATLEQGLTQARAIDPQAALNPFLEQAGQIDPQGTLETNLAGVRPLTGINQAFRDVDISGQAPQIGQAQNIGVGQNLQGLGPDQLQGLQGGFRGIDPNAAFQQNIQGVQAVDITGQPGQFADLPSLDIDIENDPTFAFLLGEAGDEFSRQQLASGQFRSGSTATDFEEFKQGLALSRTGELEDRALRQRQQIFNEQLAQQELEQSRRAQLFGEATTQAGVESGLRSQLFGEDVTGVGIDQSIRQQQFGEAQSRDQALMAQRQQLFNEGMSLDEVNRITRAQLFAEGGTEADFNRITQGQEFGQAITQNQAQLANQQQLLNTGFGVGQFAQQQQGQEADLAFGQSAAESANRSNLFGEGVTGVNLQSQLRNQLFGEGLATTNQQFGQEQTISQQQFNQLFELSRLGANTTAQVGTTGANTAANVGNLLSNQGNVEAAAAVAPINAFNQTLNSGLFNVGQQQGQNQNLFG